MVMEEEGLHTACNLNSWQKVSRNIFDSFKLFESCLDYRHTYFMNRSHWQMFKDSKFRRFPCASSFLRLKCLVQTSDVLEVMSERCQNKMMRHIIRHQRISMSWTLRLLNQYQPVVDSEVSGGNGKLCLTLPITPQNSTELPNASRNTLDSWLSSLELLNINWALPDSNTPWIIINDASNFAMHLVKLKKIPETPTSWN